MRFPGGAVRAAAVVFWWWLVSAARSEFTPDPYTAMGDVMSGVMADDPNWAPVLTMRIKLDEDEATKDASVAELLKEVGMADRQVIDVLPVIKRLAKSRSSTGTELEFGVRVLGGALSCQLSSTVLLHTYFMAAFARREYVDAPTVRSTVSKIQSAVARYADKLAAFGRSVAFLRQYSDAVNALFAKHDADAELPVTAFSDVLNELVEMARVELREHCGDTDEQTIATTHRATDYSDSLLQNLEHVDEHQLLTVIEDLETYDYVDFVSGGFEFWKHTFRIVDYRVKGNSLVEEEKEDTDDE